MTVRPFVFSCDAHVAEPYDLFTARMPAHMKDHIIHQRIEDGRRDMCVGDRVIIRGIQNFAAHKSGVTDALFAQQSEDSVDTTRRGARDLSLRAADMDRDGVDAELVFPSLGLLLPRIEDPEAQATACGIWNDWVWDYTQTMRDRLIPSAMIPCIDFDLALAELKRVIAIGFAAATLWEGLNNYNDPRWDPIFALAAEHGVPLVFHTGLGDINIRALKGPGGALFNYTRQMNDAVDVITQLIGGGVLDRNPGAHILFAEHSAGWLYGLAERMDEVYIGHSNAVTPKLSRMPGQILRDQVHSALQNDFMSSLAIRKGIGTSPLLFATDYPHSEGTFPFTPGIVESMRKENPDLTVDEWVDILGGNAAKLFSRANLQPRVEERRAELLAAA
ncbi:MAG TPA: amidohydrolase family protein [Novosphingobium sp.]|nr:amidohydrolase family protein [Novosphingobium sp.]